MIRTMGNLLRAVFCIGVTGLIGYYNFGVNGWIGLATNIAFFALGFLLLSTWKSPEKSESDPSLEAQSSNGTTPNVVVVERQVEIVKPTPAMVPEPEVNEATMKRTNWGVDGTPEGGWPELSNSSTPTTSQTDLAL